MTVDKRAALNAKKIRNRMAALAAKTVARGATPSEAAAAAEKLGWFQARERGRPSTGKALSNTERSRKYRAKHRKEDKPNEYD